MASLVSAVLLGGVSLSALVLAAGLVLFLWRGPAELGPTSAAQSAGLPLSPYPTTIPGIWAGLTAADPLAVIQLGVLLLISTPVLRVATSVLLYVGQGDRLFSVITLVVLAILLFGLFGPL